MWYNGLFLLHGRIHIFILADDFSHILRFYTIEKKWWYVQMYMMRIYKHFYHVLCICVYWIKKVMAYGHMNYVYNVLHLYYFDSKNQLQL